MQIKTFTKLIEAIIGLWLDGTLLPAEYYYDGITVTFKVDKQYDVSPVEDMAGVIDYA